MKKNKQNPKIEFTRKTARKAIQLRIIASLKAIAGQFGYNEEKLTKKVKKGSKKLAKTISKELNIEQAESPETTKEVKTSPVSTAVNPVNKSKPVAAAPKAVVTNKTTVSKPVVQTTPKPVKAITKKPVTQAKPKPVKTAVTKLKTEKK